MEDSFQGIVLCEQSLGKRAVLLLVKIGVAERFDGGGEVNCLDVILHVEMKRSNMIPEAR